MRFRGKSIRRKIVALLLVPLVSLTAIWAFATVITGREAMQLLDASAIIDKAGQPAEDAVNAVQQERRQTLILLADPRQSDALPLLHTQQRKTDEAIARLRDAESDSTVHDRMNSESEGLLDDVLKASEGLDSLRRKVEDNGTSRTAAYEYYNKLVDLCYAFRSSLHAVPDTDLDKQGRALVAMIRAREALSREDALYVSALTARKLTLADLKSMSDLIAERTLLYNTNLPILPASEQKVFADYRRTNAAPAALRIAEGKILATMEPSQAIGALDREHWENAAGPVLNDYDRLGDEATDRLQKRIDPVANSVLLKAGAAAVLGLLAFVLSVFVSVRIGRGLVRDLSRLRNDAQEASSVRLPSVMRRLGAGEQVDVEREVPRLQHGPDEMGQVGHALNTLQRAAVEAAVKQAELRQGVSDVFVNLARRSQVLLHRQLTLLDAMERRTEDTDELADLFRLDHMTTRMRRHAEGLVILSGAAPSRQWRKPIQLMDVVRAAVAEVEDYERIEIRRLPRIAVNGPAVGDLTHLIAELLENATVFSPPHTAVQVHGERVAKGFTLEIHDRGLGMTPDALTEANLRLAETPEFELSDTDRLGLFVVSRLAQRQGVRVSLQPSAYGGTTAVVLIPAALLTESGPDPDGPGADADTGRQRTRQRGAALPKQRRPRGPSPSVVSAPSAEQHQQAPDSRSGAREGGPAPLPRRVPPVLVSDHGHPVDDSATGRHTRPSWAERREQTPDEATEEPRNQPQHQTQHRTQTQERDQTRHPEQDPGARNDGEDRRHDQASAPERTAPPRRDASGLPKRVRQASLAPQLKNDPEPPAESDRYAADTDPERDAEQARATMASLQRGWQRGRRQTATGSGGSDTAPGTRDEGDGR
ncbi:nitrate- and nitrite sensing domain-containing protein [Streptomyces sp. RTd22]|uniref:sensor histidine kinase n=1 Tax=Streptomyces sp. RTd22 TaxID=1841249 RepID=UPI0007C4A625|nr:nitrate- and nitrite sensing domain-containing protein [Streptomyces sp. RTd22]